MIVRRTMSRVTGYAVLPESGLMRHFRFADHITDLPVATPAEYTWLLPDDKTVVGAVGRMTIVAPAFGNRGMRFLCRILRPDVAMTFRAQGASFLLFFQVILRFRCVQAVAARTVACCKGLVQTEPAPLISLNAMAGEAKSFLVIGQEDFTG
jgi:hypothetical protein